MPLRNVNSADLVSPTAVDEAELRESLDKLTTWLDSQKAQRQREIIVYILNEELEDRAHLIKAYTIAVDIFGKDEDFDPSVNSLVRVEMHRLRSSLNRFYEQGAAGAPYVFEIPSGKYRLKVLRNDRVAVTPSNIPNCDQDSRTPLIAHEMTEESREPENNVTATLKQSDPDTLSHRQNGSGIRFRFNGKILLAVVALVALSLSAFILWDRNTRQASLVMVDKLAPSLKIIIDPKDKNYDNLNEIAKLLESKAPTPFPVAISLDADADYFLRLWTFIGPDGVEMVESALYDKDRSLVNTESQPAKNLDNLSQRTTISDAINDQFLAVDGYVSMDFSNNQDFPETRRKIYACYRTLNLVLIGRSIAPPDIDKNLACLNPSQIVEQKDKLLIYILRSNIIAASASGMIKTKNHYSIARARAELDAASAIYPDEISILAQKILLEWRDPNRDDQRLSALQAKAEKGVMSAELRYNVAISYAYFLGEYAEGKRIANDNTAVQQGLRQAMGDLYHLIELPEFMVKKDYQGVLTMLKRTGASGHPTYAIFSAAAACGLGDAKEISSSLKLVSENEVLNEKSLKQYVRNRNYAPNVENALIDALSSPTCSSQIG